MAARDDYPHCHMPLALWREQHGQMCDEIDRLQAMTLLPRDPVDDLADLLDATFGGALGWVLGRGNGTLHTAVQDWYVMADWEAWDVNEWRIHVTGQTIRDVLRDALEASK